MTHLLSTLSKAFLFGLLCTTCSVVPVGAQDCNYTLVMEDTGGDGWGDAVVRIDSYDLEGAVFATVELTLTAGFREEVPIDVLHGANCVIYFDTATSNNHEISFRLRSNGITVVWVPWGPPTGIIYVGEVNCIWTQPCDCDCTGAWWFTYDGYQPLVRPRPSLEPGDVYDLGPSSQGCLDGETHGIWLRHTIGGVIETLEMTIEVTANYGPTEPQLDFAVWGPFTGDPILECASLAQPLRCSAAVGFEPTGMDMGALDESEGIEGDGWVRGIEVDPGQSFLIYVESNAPYFVEFSLEVNGQMPIATEVRSPDQGAINGIVVDNGSNSGALHVSTPVRGALISTVQLFNATGQLVRSSSVGQVGGSASVQLEIEDLSAGVYVVRAFDSAPAVLGFARFVKE